MHTTFFILFTTRTFSALFFPGTFALREIIHIYFNTYLMLLFNFLTEVSKASICKKNHLPTLELSWVYNNKQTNTPSWEKKKKHKSSSTKHFGNPNGTKGAFVIGLQNPGSIQGDTVVGGRGKHHIIGRCRIFNLAFEGHHSQNVAIGLTGLTLGNSFSKYTNLWMVRISLSSCLNVNQLKGNVTEVTVWGCSLCLTFLSISQEDNERGTKPKHYHSPIQW